MLTLPVSPLESPEERWKLSSIAVGRQLRRGSRLQLYEHEAKTLLTRYGINVPRGGLWGALPANLSFPVAVKAQILAGSRGKRGGIRRVDTPAELASAVAALQELVLDGNRAIGILVEEWMVLGEERYVALIVDRDERRVSLLATSSGGIHVEYEPMARYPIDPWTGPGDSHLSALAELYGIGQETVRPFLTALWQVFTVEDASLIEINPFAVHEGRAIVLDARIVLDDNARFRHPLWPPARDGTAFEQRCAALGSSGVEMDGDIAVVTSGAGLAMASVDLLLRLGGRVRVAVDLGPVVFQEPERIAKVIDLVVSLQPRLILFNFFLQLVSCDTVAAGIVAAIRAHGNLQVLVRIRGPRAEIACSLLAEAGATICEDLKGAFEAAVAVSAAS